MMASTDWDKVIRRMRVGDREAWDTLYREFRPLVLAVARSHCDAPEEAQDVTERVLAVDLHRKLRSFREYRGRQRLESWLRSVTLNALRDRWRSRRRRRDALRAFADLDTSSVPPRSTTLEAAIDLERALEALSPGERGVFVLHEVEGLSHREVGTRLGIRAGTSRVRLCRARAKLRRLFRGGEAP